MFLEFVGVRDEGESRAIGLQRCIFDDGLEGKDEASCVFDKRKLAYVLGGLKGSFISS